MSDPNNPSSNPYGEQPAQPSGQQPPAYGSQPPAYGGQQSYGQQPPAYGQQSYSGYGGGSDPDKRPGTVTAASIITIIFSTLGMLGFGLLAIVLAVARDDIIDEIDREMEGQPGFEDVTADDLANIMIVIFLVLTIWCLIALVTSVLALKRQNWARIVTVISAVMSALLSLLAIGSGISAITLIASIATVVLYFTGGANDWYARKGAGNQQAAGTNQPWG